MDQVLIAKIVESLADGDTHKAIGYGLIFFVIWIEVRGMKKQLKFLNTTISESFKAGEKRFETIESDVHQIRVDLNNLKTQGG